MKALISVYNKEGIVDFAKELIKLNWEILSTGGTAKLLRESGIKVMDISEYTKFPEMMDGRVKTMHPKVLGGLLARRGDQAHMQQAKEHDISMIDMVVVNLYPFEETVKKNLSQDETIEMIDVGGPTMLRSASKNYKDVLVVADPKDYASIIGSLKSGRIGEEKRKDLAKKAFQRTAEYDAAISRYFSDGLFPEKLILPYTKKQIMRYGENPHQQAAFYTNEVIEPSVATSQQLQGKELSYNNIMDADSALEIVKQFPEPAVAVIKHSNPSGVATSDKINIALERAYIADALSAFGCVIALNRMCTRECAEFLSDKFVEVIIAQGYDQDALTIFSRKKNLRLLQVPHLEHCLKEGCIHEPLTTKKVVGGLLVQTRDFPKLSNIEVTDNPSPTVEEIQNIIPEWQKTGKITFICPTENKPTQEQLQDMLFAIKVCKHVKSNSVILVKNSCTIGIGAGQMSRVDSSMIATRKAGEGAKNSVCCSDAFFPFRDGVDELAKAGVKAIIQPGGSIRDKEVIDSANEHGMAMIFSGIRLFLH